MGICAIYAKLYTKSVYMYILYAHMYVYQTLPKKGSQIESIRNKLLLELQ